MSCLAPPFETVAEDCLGVRVELAGRFSQYLPDLGLSRSFSLPRARLQFAGGRGPIQVHIATVAVRSGGEEGYIGVAGEAIVPAVQIAELRWIHEGLRAGVGMVDDPWTVASEEGWFREAGPSFGEEAGWMSRSDLGAWLGWVRGPVAVQADLSSGEGAFQRERNTEKDLAGSISYRPLSAIGLTVYGRQGFTGLGEAPSHRLGAQLHLNLADKVSVGAEILKAWGVENQALREPVGASLWMVTHPWGPFLGFARIDLASEKSKDPTAGWSTFRLGGGASLGAARLVAGWEYRSAGDGVAEVAGTGAASDMNQLYLQASVDLRWETP